MAAETIYTENALAKMKQHGLELVDVQEVLEKGEFRDSEIPGAEHRAAYLKSREMLVGVVYSDSPGGKRVIVDCWGRKQ